MEELNYSYWFYIIAQTVSNWCKNKSFHNEGNLITKEIQKITVIKINETFFSDKTKKIENIAKLLTKKLILNYYSLIFPRK